MAFDGSNFDLQRYVGTWYSIAKYPTVWEDNIPLVDTETGEKAGSISCDFSVAEYGALRENGSLVGASVQNTCYVGINPVTRSDGKVYPLNVGDLAKGKLYVVFQENSATPALEPNYIVHYTDYETVSIVSNGFKTEHPMLWILCRRLVVDDSLIKLIKCVLNRLRIDKTKLVGIHSSRLKSRSLEDLLVSNR